MDIGRNPSLQTSAWGWAAPRTGIQGLDRLNVVCGARPIKAAFNRPRGPGRAQSVHQPNRDLRELPQIPQALGHSCGACITSGDGEARPQAATLTLRTRVAKALRAHNDTPSHATAALGLRLLRGSEQSALRGPGPILILGQVQPRAP